MDKPSVFILNRELELIIPLLSSTYRPLGWWECPSPADVAETRVLICFGHQSPMDIVAQMPCLELVACFTTGYDGIDVDTLRTRGVRVTNAAGATAEPVAEFALAQIFCAYRNIVGGDRLLRAGEWVRGSKPLLGRSVIGARIGIVGLGAIGTALARRCELLGMVIEWWGPRAKPDASWPRAESLLALAARSDVLVVCTSADAANTGMISDRIIDALGPEGLLVNVARGQLVDEDALIEALRSGRLGGAALDVYADEPTGAERWADVPNVICTPHIAGATREGLSVMTKMLERNLAAFFAGDLPPNLIG